MKICLIMAGPGISLTPKGICEPVYTVGQVHTK